MRTRETAKAFTRVVLIICFVSWSALAENVSGDPPGHGKGRPKVEFDDEESPLQGAVVGARDKRWLKKSGQGSDARCARVIKAMAADPQDQKTIGRLCVDDEGEPLETGRECLERYCEDADCAEALVSGNEPDIQDLCGISAEDKKCAKAIFGGSRRAVECLQNPYDEQGDLKPKCKQLLEDCDDIPALKRTKKESFSGKIKNPHDKLVGRRIETETVVHYQKPKQRGAVNGQQPKDKWDAIQIRRSGKKQHHVPGVFNDQRPGRHGSRVRSAGLLVPDCDDQGNCNGTISKNNDNDCVDQVTGEHKRDAECFDDQGKLLLTLQPSRCLVEDADGNATEVDCCIHESGAVFYGDPSDELDDDCWDENGDLRTTLQESIDEDPPDFVNDDGDCTGPDGLSTSDCLDADGNLRAGFEWQINEEVCGDDINNDNDCMLEDGTITTDCLDVDNEIRDDVLWLVDEDCPEEIDNDGDGQTNEDGPEVTDPDEDEDEKETCRAFFRTAGLQARNEELPDKDHGCDLSRAMIVHVNNRAKDHPNHGGKKFFKADEFGDPDGDPDAEGDVEIGKEERRVTLNEVYAVKCKKTKINGAWEDTHYDEESGLCVPDDERLASMARPDRGALLGVLDRQTRTRKRGDIRDVEPSERPTREPPKRLNRGEEPCIAPECARAMMGFTFAPPVLEWGVRIKEEVCIFGFCIEIFYARIGYEFDLAAGLRLPVEVRFDGVPDSILAEESFDLAASLQPLDFSVKDYREFCEQHNLDDDWFISDCERFAFPDFLDAMLPIAADDMDGDEFVAHYSIFAGIIVRLFYIPLINWAVDSSVDVPAMCTMFKIKDQVAGVSLMDLLNFGRALAEDRSLLTTLKEQLANCGSFTTPFGEDPESDELRSFPFLNASYSVRADCFDAARNGEFITIKGKKRPMCTGLILGTSGASLGVGLGIEATAGSRLIKADWRTEEDAEDAEGVARFTHSSDDPAGQDLVIGPVRADNYDDTPHHDHARILLDDFTYYLNAMQIKLSANIEFGGILSPIPDIGSFTLFKFAFDTGEYGIPIPQHPGTEPIEVAVEVENYGLALDVSPVSDDPDVRVDDETLRIEPGEFGDYLVQVTNIGSFEGDFDNFARELSNRPFDEKPVDTANLTFVIDPNTDHDCVDDDAPFTHHFGDPYAPLPDDACYGQDGLPHDDVTELIDEDPSRPEDQGKSSADRDEDGDELADEDPVDDWRTLPDDFTESAIEDIPKHSQSVPEESLVLSVSPFRHPLTSPGIYAFQVRADSRDARELNLAPVDPSGNYRLGATDVAFIEVIAFFDPQVTVLPGAPEVTPGMSQAFIVEGTNGANVADSMELVRELLDFNQANCSLVNMGRLPEGSDPDCPYRAVPTIILDQWIGGVLPEHFGPLDPLGVEAANFSIEIPSDWEGMDDTTYQFVVTAISVEDPDEPPASNYFVANYTVEATLESMTRYIGLEIEELIGEIESANAQGFRTGGLLAIATHPIRMSNQRALERVLAGDPRGAARAHGTTIRTTEAFIRALAGFGGDGTKIPKPYMFDWEQRAEALIADLRTAVAHGS